MTAACRPGRHKGSLSYSPQESLNPSDEFKYKCSQTTFQVQMCTNEMAIRQHWKAVKPRHLPALLERLRTPGIRSLLPRSCKSAYLVFISAFGLSARRSWEQPPAGSRGYTHSGRDSPSPCVRPICVAVSDLPFNKLNPGCAPPGAGRF